MHDERKKRQRAITREQVRNKMHEAASRADKAIQDAYLATNEIEYNKAIRAGCKASHDYKVWYDVLAALTT